MISYKITNENLFDEKVIDVMTDDMKPVYHGNKFDGASGTLDIEVEPANSAGCGEHRQFSGQHGKFDYEED